MNKNEFKEKITWLKEIVTVDDWDHDGSPAVPESVFTKVEYLIDKLETYPDVYPTGRKELQLEFSHDHYKYIDYLEFTVGEDNICMLNRISKYGDIRHSDTPGTVVIDLPESHNNKKLDHLTKDNIVEIVREWVERNKVGDDWAFV